MKGSCIVALVLALATGTQAFSVKGFGGRRIRFTPKIGGSGNSGAGGGGNNNLGPFGLGASGDETPEEPAEAAPVAKADEKGGLAGIWESYNNALESKPILIKGLTSFTGFALGDILAQSFIEKDSEFDVQRFLRLASFGLLIHGPTSHYFYGALDGAIKGTGALAVASKVGIDQIIWNPIFGCAFFSYIGMLEGAGIEGCKLKIKNDLMTAVTGSWKRLLYINSIQIFYNVFLSIVANKT